MLFTSVPFVGFFAVVFVAYWSVPWPRARVWLLLAASVVFYANWSRWLALLVVGSSVADYLIGLGLDAAESDRTRNRLLGLSLAANLGLLAYFKYVNFFLGSLTAALNNLGVDGRLPLLDVIVPLGISFYTFESISYIVDVYRRRIRAERSLPNFLLFILFFPHLVAGPIVRARDFLPQVRRRKRWNWVRLRVGVQYCLIGMVKKLVIADHMGLIADPVFANPWQYGTAAVWVATAAYLMQVYGDFSGYSDLAMGTAQLLGYRLTKNFDLPYLAPNLSDLWRRWHMSLSGWLRDYVFIPLGGSRGGTGMTVRNLFITMTLCGLWHGASWNYVLFGVLQGGLLTGLLMFQRCCASRPRVEAAFSSSPGVVASTALTLATFALSLVLFRAQSLTLAGVMYSRLFRPSAGDPPGVALRLVLTAALIMAVGHGLAVRSRWRWVLERTPAPVRGLGYALLVLVPLAVAPAANRAFIYFQF